MRKDTDKVIREYLASIGRKGGKARAERHTKAELSKWAKLGGRPKKSSGGKGDERLQTR
jgi:hypothetical protein